MESKNRIPKFIVGDKVKSVTSDRRLVIFGVVSSVPSRKSGTDEPLYNCKFDIYPEDVIRAEHNLYRRGDELKLRPVDKEDEDSSGEKSASKGVGRKKGR